MNKWLFCLLLCVLSPGAWGRDIDITLCWDPGKDIDRDDVEQLDLWRDHRIMVLPFTDDRRVEPRGYVGKHDDNYALTGLDVGQWWTAATRHILRELGLNVVTSNPSIIVKGSLRAFFVNEESVYQGLVNVVAEVTDAEGNVLLHESVRGESRYWGSTFQDDNYRHAIGNACIDWVDNLLSHPALLRIVGDLPAVGRAGTSGGTADIAELEGSPVGAGDYRLFVSGPPPGKPNVQTGFAIGLLGAGMVMLVQGVVAPSYSFRRPAFTAGGIMLCAGSALGTVAAVRWSMLHKWNAQFQVDAAGRQAGVEIACGF